MRSFLICMAAGVAMVAVVGCTADAVPVTGCNVDEDCAAGLYCGSGGCHADCRVAGDCVAMGPSAVCTARGRCESGVDGGLDGAVSTTCVSIEDCTDGLFCNGVEYCDTLDPNRDERGCVQGPPPCSAADCDEPLDTCDPCRDADEDRDGYRDIACPGGTDCNDQDARVNPGAPEICDAENVDEDCNPRTLGARSEDQDGDGFWPPATEAGTPCCNGDVCGNDCADIPGVDIAARDRFPGARESCNELDDNCDGRIDEGVQVLFYRDADCDGYGIEIPIPIRYSDGSLPAEVAPYARLGCPATLGATTCVPGTTPGWVIDRRDCNDTNYDIAPGRVDTCDVGMVDENCNGIPNEGCACTVGGPAVRCGPSTDVGACNFGTAECVPPGVVSATCTGAIYPAAETCIGAGRGQDDDCDGATDEGLINACGQCTQELPPEICDGVDNDCTAPVDPGECVLGGPPRDRDDECGAPVRELCTFRDTNWCQWGAPVPRLGVFGYGYSSDDPGTTHDRTCSAYDYLGNGWSVRNRPGVGCPDFIGSPVEHKLPGNTPMVATTFIRWDGCVRFQIEVQSTVGQRALGAETVLCDTGSTSISIPFTTPPRWYAGDCPGVQILVHALDLPASTLWVSSFLLSPG
jgi:hypothetical protein